MLSRLGFCALVITIAIVASCSSSSSEGGGAGTGGASGSTGAGGKGGSGASTTDGSSGTAMGGSGTGTGGTGGRGSGGTSTSGTGGGGSGGAGTAGTGGLMDSSEAGDACPAGWDLLYWSPGCSTAPICTQGPYDACAGTFCGCDGNTFSGGCGSAQRPFASYGPCPDAADDGG